MIASAPLGFRYRKWPYNNNKLTVNTEKTYTMLTGSQLYLDNDAPLSVNINRIPLVQRNEFIYLEVTIDSHLTWVPHINSICKKVAPKIVALSRLRYILPYESLYVVYSSITLLNYLLNEYII